MSETYWTTLPVYIGTRPSQASVQAVCRKVSELTPRRYGWIGPESMVRRLNRVLIGWSNYFKLVQVTAAYSAVDRHTSQRLRHWLSRKHQLKSGKFVKYSKAILREDYGLISLGATTSSLPWAKA